MNEIHNRFIDHLLANSKLQLDSSDREKLAHMFFMNFRGWNETARGIRLTGRGLTYAKQNFESFVIPIDRSLSTQEILFLDRRCRLPYFFDKTQIVVFEDDLGVMLKLSNGNISLLI